MYREIPDNFEPTAIVGSTYYFEDGPYNSEISHYVIDQDSGTDYSYSRAIVSAATDESTPNPFPLSGVRRVRNIVVAGELHLRLTSSATPSVVIWQIDLILIPNGLGVTINDNLLASYHGCSMVSAKPSVATTFQTEAEEFRIAYPGFVDLHRGDTLVWRLSARKSVGTELLYVWANFGSQCCVRNA